MTDTIHKLTIAGKSFNVSPRFAEGHVLTANEANALNQTYFENLRNNFAEKAKKGGEEGDQAAFDKYAEAYKFGERTGGGGGSRDPVEVEAMNLARDAIKKGIVAKGGKVGDYTAAAISTAAAKLVEAKPEFREKAKERVAQMQAVASETLGDDIMAALTEANKPSEGEGEAQTEGEPAAEGAGEEAAAETEQPTGRRGRRG